MRKAKWNVTEDMLVNKKFQAEMRKWIEDSAKMAGTAKTAYVDKDGHWKTMIDGKEVPAPTSLQERVDALKQEINKMSYEYSYKAVELIKASGCIELIQDEEMLIWQASDRFEQDIEAAIDKAGTRVAITSLTGLVHDLAKEQQAKATTKKKGKRNVK
jgi:hypothetical protein